MDSTDKFIETTISLFCSILSSDDNMEQNDPTDRHVRGSLGNSSRTYYNILRKQHRPQAAATWKWIETMRQERKSLTKGLGKRDAPY
jgi:hypothetical protein